MSDLKINNITNRGGDGGPVIAGVSTVSSSAFMIMPNGNTETRGASSGRGVIGGGYPSNNTLQFVTIATTGNASDFGDLTRTAHEGAMVGSSTRGIMMGGVPATFTIDYFTFSSGGGANDFGDLNAGAYEAGGCSNGHGGLG